MRVRFERLRAGGSIPALIYILYCGGKIYVVDLSSKSRILPTQPGVYLFKNAEGSIIYVGKAKDLRARVRTYFLAGSQENAKTGSLVREAADFETIVVDTEAEALALENTLIKQHQPRFNVLLRDDKTYPYIRLSQETFPRVSVTRRVARHPVPGRSLSLAVPGFAPRQRTPAAGEGESKAPREARDGSEYFGPYFPAGLAYRTLHFIQKYFQLCSCKRDLSRPHARPCFQYQLHRCLGPCMPGLVTEERYQQAVRDTRLFLSGRQPELARDLRRRRDAAAAGERFEEAAGYRDLLTVLEDIQERQKMHAVEGQDADVVGLYREGARAALHVFPMRHGRVVDRREFFWEALPDEEASDAELLGALLKQIYLEQPYLPPRIDAPMDFEDRAALETALTAQRGSKVEIALPQRGAKKEMLELAERNARLSFARRFRAPSAEQQAEEQWAALGRALGLDLSAGRWRVECFDISHFQGAETVASMVVWAAGKMRRGEYRRYRIREVEGVDDFRSMAEVVRRRYRRRLAEGGELPGLILIDGGIGQLHAAQAVLADLGLEQVPLASLAKREELVFVPGREAEPVRLDHHSGELHLLQMIRDEAHRFAITFHRERRGKANVRSELLAVPGIGPATTRKLLRHFGSLNAVRSADAEALGSVLPAARVQAVWEHLHPAPAEILKN